ncbi:methylmalonyl-CoA mutase subunit beta [Neobacillus rhizosphaerae]|uniref:methylmalonyl-CoA mutase subunit beta n=1 Tax=Neobacillus rhizosphaerae TaxID=2880965 RepID=UPI003D28FEC0
MRSLDKIKNQSFPFMSTQEWKEKAEKSLKGRTVESLQTATYEEIILKPLYSQGDEQAVPDYPGGSDFRRGIHPLGYLTNEWKVAQRLSYQTMDELKEKLKQNFDKGQSAISFEVSKSLFEEDDTLETILGESYRQYPFSINAMGLHSTLLAALETIGEKKGTSDTICGYIGSDPVALFAEEGRISEEFLNDWMMTIVRSSVKLPNLRTILINTSPYHNGGANAVQELGVALAEGIYYIEKLQEAGMELEDIFPKMIFQFSIGGHFYMEMAKLRAARILWNRVAEVYGTNVKNRGMHISAETSRFTKTVQDPHVNLLRAGNEAFAAVIGGIQYLHVDPFNNLSGSTRASERIARNTQLLLKEEAQLKQVIDPAGGSWYVEQLTNELAEKSWGFFQQIEAHGGIVEGLKSNWLQKEIAAVYDKRNKDCQTRKQSMIGTNVYANLDESVPNLKSENKDSYVQEKGNSLLKICAIPQRRLSEPFEELRNKARNYEEAAGYKPSVGMICLGELKEYKARLDFMKGFLAAGGVKAVESDPIVSLENTRSFVSSLPGTKCFCICGTNEQYETTGHEVLTSLRTEFPDRVFFLAGLPEKDKQSQWTAEGIKQFIHLKSNCYETLDAIFKELEVSTVEETKA